MKRLVLFSLLALTVTSVNAQVGSDTTSVKMAQNFSQPQQVIDIVRYKLYPTQNIWNFIKLDTRTGKMWQVQFGMDGDNRSECVLNEQNLVTLFEGERIVIRDGEEINGRFTLYPTQNIYNFILLDQLTGKTYQAQWSFDEENRGIVPIE